MMTTRTLVIWLLFRSVNSTVCHARMGSAEVRALIWIASGMGCWMRLTKISSDTDCYYCINKVQCSIHVYYYCLFILCCISWFLVHQHIICILCVLCITCRQTVLYDHKHYSAITSIISCVNIHIDYYTVILLLSV